MKKLVILGSTGSIGTNTLDIVSKFPGKFHVIGMTAGAPIGSLVAGRLFGLGFAPQDLRAERSAAVR